MIRVATIDTGNGHVWALLDNGQEIDRGTTPCTERGAWAIGVRQLQAHNARERQQ